MVRERAELIDIRIFFIASWVCGLAVIETERPLKWRAAKNIKRMMAGKAAASRSFLEENMVLEIVKIK